MISNKSAKSHARIIVFLTAVFLLFTAVQLPLLAQQNVSDVTVDKDVPYVPTPDKVVDKMLDMADVQSGDYVIDLGSGDGRIVINAAKRGASGHGFDIDPTRVSEARLNAKKENVSDRVVFERGDIFEQDFSQASVITMYLLPGVNVRLRSDLLNHLEPGTRIVSHDYGLGDWEADRHVTITDDSFTGSHEIYYWVVPAQVEGLWETTVDDKDFRLQFNQNYQEVEATLQADYAKTLSVQEASVHGERVEVVVEGNGVRYLMNGRVKSNDDEKFISGTVQLHQGESSKTVNRWTAQRPN